LNYCHRVRISSPNTAVGLFLKVFDLIIENKTDEFNKDLDYIVDNILAHKDVTLSSSDIVSRAEKVKK